MSLQRASAAVERFVRMVQHRGQVNGFLDSFFATPDSWGTMGSVRPNELPFLKELCEEASRHPGPIVEIGTLFGFASTKIALWKRPEQRLLTVDNYSWNPCGFPPAAHKELAARVLEFVKAREHVEQLDCDKQRFFDDYRGDPPAMVFMDADHGYEPTREDIAWARRVKAHIICGHDYGPEFPGVIRAVEEAGGPTKLVGSLWRVQP